MYALNLACTVCAHTIHTDETLEPLTWIRLRPSHHYEHTLECSHDLKCAFFISNYMTFKQIACVHLSFIILETSNGSHPNPYNTFCETLQIIFQVLRLS